MCVRFRRVRARVHAGANGRALRCELTEASAVFRCWRACGRRICLTDALGVGVNESRKARNFACGDACLGRHRALTTVEPEKTKATESRPREPLAAPPEQKPRRLEPLSADRYGVDLRPMASFASYETWRGLAGHRLPSGDLMTLLERGLEAYERELSKQRFAVGSKPRRKRGLASARSAPGSPAPYSSQARTRARAEPDHETAAAASLPGRGGAHGVPARR